MTMAIHSLVITIRKAKARNEIVLSKTLSLPLTLIEEILDEADLTGQSFSACFVSLAKTGLAHRQYERDIERKRQNLQSKFILESSKIQEKESDGSN